MRHFTHALGFVFILSMISFAQFTQDDLPEVFPGAKNHIRSLGKQIKQLRDREFPRQAHPASPGDLIIGQNDPNEVVTITGGFVQNGDIIIVNNGALNLNSADFRIDGDITILGNGRMNIRGGHFTVIQAYIYEHQALVLENGVLQIDSVDFQTSGQSWGFAAVDHGRLILRDSRVSDGFITHTFFGQAAGQIEGTQLPGEFLCFGNNNLKFRNNDLLMFWTVLFDFSAIDITLPGDSLITGWTLTDSLPNVSGIPYSVSIDSCTNVNWGLISRSGSDATFRDTKFRVAGLMFTKTDSITVENITNGSHHVDDIVAVPDRNLHLINTDVATWNFYPFADAKITIQNCIFGELIASDSSETFINNSLCDGSGGYLGVESQAELLVFNSLVNSQVIASGNGVFVSGISAFNSTHIVAADFSVMVFFNTLRMNEPQVFDGGNVFDGFFPPVDGYTESNLPLIGTAQLLTGPQSPLQFTGYMVEYTDESQQPPWLPTDGFHAEMVVDDTLALWNTAGLLPGAYVLRFSMLDNFGDTLAFNSTARLQDQVTGILYDGSDEVPVRFALAQNYPNPFNPETAISYQLPAQSDVRLDIYNSLGQKVRTLEDRPKAAGRYILKWDGRDDAGQPVASGVYLYRLQAGKQFARSRKMLLLR